MSDAANRIEGEITSIHSHPGTYFVGVETAEGGRTVRVSKPKAIDHEDLSSDFREALVGDDMEASGIGRSYAFSGTLTEDGYFDVTPEGIEAI